MTQTQQMALVNIQVNNLVKQLQSEVREYMGEKIQKQSNTSKHNTTQHKNTSKQRTWFSAWLLCVTIKMRWLG